jgi:hypothetical protein
VCVILDDDEVSSNEDEHLQKWLRWLSSAWPSGPACAAADGTAATTAATDEVTDKRVAEESTVRRVMEEAAVKAAADEVTNKTADEATGAFGDSPAPGQAPSVAGDKRVALQVAPPHQPNDPTGHLQTSVCPASFFWWASF